MKTHCKIYLRSFLERSFIVQLVVRNISGRFERFGGISTSILDIDIRKNDEYNKEFMDSREDGFLFYPFYIDVNYLAPDRKDDTVQAVKALIDVLAENDMHGVTSGSIEGDLPGSGRF
ncbi:MAG: hypothetical protein ACRD22_08935 [Terriglobia bacterium]